MEPNTINSANRLFHYTYSKENLISILLDGLQPKYSLEKLGILKSNKIYKSFLKEHIKDQFKDKITDELAIPMCCFCDIPLNLISDHSEIYGAYSIGLKKEWGKKYSISPVFYLPVSSETTILFNILLQKIYNNQEKSRSLFYTEHDDNKKSQFYDISIVYDTLISLMMFAKPYNGSFRKNGKSFKNHKFYDEKEWRYIPDRSYLTKQDYNKYKLKKMSVKTFQPMRFKLSDITDIIVPENEVNKIRNDISRIPSYRNFDLTIIDSLENRQQNFSKQSTLKL